MSYSGPATLVLPDGTRTPGVTAIQVWRTGSGLQDWGGTFRAGSDPSVDLLTAVGTSLRLELPTGEAGEVLVQNLEGGPIGGVLRLPGSGPPPI